ncbi:cation-transporting P-type ATPase, partial [Candidatus Uhrbacteria bacterium]|nr:cation-transporting P-type ATPase [Candidatus Uhrbacteria bacterium]
MKNELHLQMLSTPAHFHSLSIEKTLTLLASEPDGLTNEEAARRLERHGPNLLPDKKQKSAVWKFLAQFKSGLVALLLIAAIISFAFDRSLDAVIILAIILVNAGIGFFQERRAEHAIAALKKLIVVSAKALRSDSPAKIPAAELVPGDIILLEEGDKIPADARLIEEQNLRAEEASLTGESVPVEKNTTQLVESTPLAERSNLVWMGTLV